MLLSLWGFLRVVSRGRNPSEVGGPSLASYFAGGPGITLFMITLQTPSEALSGNFQTTVFL